MVYQLPSVPMTSSQRPIPGMPASYRQGGEAYQRAVGRGGPSTIPGSVGQYGSASQAPNVNITAQRDPQLDALLGQQQQFAGQIGSQSGEIFDAARAGMDQQVAGLGNAAVLSALQRGGGVGAAQGRAGEVGALARSQAANALRVPLLGLQQQAINSQLPTITGQLGQMQAEKGIGLQAAGLQQNWAQMNQQAQMQQAQLAAQQQQALLSATANMPQNVASNYRPAAATRPTSASSRYGAAPSGRTRPSSSRRGGPSSGLA